MRASTLWWQFSDPRDERPWIRPHISAATSSRDYLAGRDPALEAILMPPSTTTVTDASVFETRWQGIMTPPLQSFDLGLALDSIPLGRGTLEVPAVGLENVELRDLRTEGAELTFTAPFRMGDLKFAGRLEGVRILGKITLGGVSFPFVLERSTSTP